MNFKTHFYQMLLEMPQRITSKIKIDARVEHIYEWAEEIEEIQINGIDLGVWQMKDRDDIKLWFIHNDQILVELAFTLFGQGVQENLVIQGITAGKGMAREIYVGYLLNKFSFILSDTTMTDQGFGFWKKLWKEYKSNFKFYIYDMKNKTKVWIKDGSQMDEVFGPEKDKHDFKFVIVK
jgi:hypothetical protein